MPTTTQAFSRDANRIPITANGLLVTKSFTFSEDGTITTPIFTITGIVNVVALYGVITTNFGSNVTAAYWRLNDATNQADITLNTGTTLSSAKAGSLIVKKGLAAAALTLLNSNTSLVSEPTTLETSYFSPIVIVQKTLSVATNIEFIYTTNNISAGAITFYCGFIPLSDTGNIVAV